MELKGPLETMSIPDLLQWLADSEKTGTLVVNNNTERKEIYFRSGVIVSASSNLDKDRFGVLVVKEGYVAQEELLKLLDEGRAAGKMLGRLCVEKGLFSEDEARRMLQNQAEKIIESLIHRREGEFAFYEGELPTKDIVEISIVMHQLFFDSAPKRDEWRRIHSILGSLNTVLGPSPNPPGPFLALSAFEQLLLALSDGKSSILKVCGKVDKSDFEICSVLTKLIENGWLVKLQSETNQEADQGLPDQLWQVSILLEQKRFFQANKLIEKLRSQFPKSVELEALGIKCQSQFEEDIAKTFKSDAWRPYIQPNFDSKQLQSMSFKSQEWFLYSQINGMTSLKDLYVISGLSRQKAQMILFNLYKVGAIQFKETTPEGNVRTDRTTVVPPSRAAASNPTDSIPVRSRSDANRVVVPPRRVETPLPNSTTGTPRRTDVAAGTASTQQMPVPPPEKPQPKPNPPPPQPPPPPSVPRTPVPETPAKPIPDPEPENDNPAYLDAKELEDLYRRFTKYNHYQILGVSQNSSQAHIRDSFVSLSKKYHPDMHFQKLAPNIQERLEEIFSMINHAYKVLANNNSRKRYDEESWTSQHSASAMDRVIEVIQVSQQERTSGIPDFKLKPRKPAGEDKAGAGQTQKDREAQQTTPPPSRQAARPVKVEAAVDEAEGLKELEATLLDEDTKNKAKWEVHFDEGKRLYNSGNAKQAIEQFEQALKFNAKNSDIYYALSRSYLKLPKPLIDKAEENIKKALVVSPENPTYYVQLARVYQTKGDKTAAERFCKTALAWDPDNRDAKEIIKSMQDKGKFDFLKKLKLK